MSNDASKNPITVDTVGDVTTEKHNITGFNVVPSNTNWEVILHATGSALYSKLFHAFGADKRSYPFSPARPIRQSPRRSCPTQPPTASEAATSSPATAS